MKALLTTPEITELLGLSGALIKQLNLTKVLPAEKFGKMNMIRCGDLTVLRNRKKGRPRKQAK